MNQPIESDTDGDGVTVSRNGLINLGPDTDGDRC
jgi:hypothetical protein